MNRTPEYIVITAYRQFSGKSVNETLSASEMSVGFDLLNDAMASYGEDGPFISFLSDIKFTSPAGVNEWIFTTELLPVGPPPTQLFIPSNRIVELNFVDYLFGTLQCPIYITSKNQYYNTLKVNNVPGLPTVCFLTKERTRSIVTIYPVPSQPIPVSIKCKLSISPLTQFVDITQVPSSYFEFLTYLLGRRLVSFYRQGTWSAADNDLFTKLERRILNINEWDCSVITDQTINRRGYAGAFVVNGVLVI